MFEIIKNVISEKQFELSDILKKINTVWVQGGISDEEKTELVGMARSNADTGGSIDITAKLEELDRRVRALEGGGSEPSEEYPDYTAGKWYYGGGKVSFEGKNYVCTAPEGQVCTWSPTEYPAYWEEISDDA